MNKLRVAAVGLGWVALNRHLPVMARNHAFEVVGVIDKAPGRAESVARERGYRNFAETDNLERVDWLSEVDAITVATAPMGHYSVIKQALLLGKHVLTEKPFAMAVGEGEELVEIARARGLHLGIVHNFQFSGSMKRLLADISAGKLGTIRGVNGVQFGNPNRRLPKWYEDLPLGLFYDESPHLLYLTRRVAGPIEVARCLTFPSSTGLKTPARMDVIFHSPLNCPTSLHLNFESPVSEWHFCVFGDERLGIVDIFRDIYLSLPNDGRHKSFTVLRTSLYATGQHLWQTALRGISHLANRMTYGNEDVFARFHAAVSGRGEEPDPIGTESALAVLRLQHEILGKQEIITRGAARGHGA
ncbi:MAG TPA: Gfo/Idh/MocA family oxidoreductase [Terriglobales bacterium]|nr:Gfo/Idh/MocA family oxidoreductase [Terriglobales bacterium]